MGLMINKGSVYSTLASSNSALVDNANSCIHAKNAINNFKNNTALTGAGYDGIREHFSNHISVLDGLIGYTDDMLSGNSKYESAMSSNLTSLNQYDEDKLTYRLKNIRTGISVCDPLLPHMLFVFRLLEKMVLDQLNELYNFTSGAGTPYSNATSAISIVSNAISLLGKTKINPKTGAVITPPGLKGAIAALDRYNEEKKASGFKCLQVDSKSAQVIGLKDCYLFSKDPVNLSTGNFIYKKEDIKVEGASNLAFGRFYNATDECDYGLGRGWAHSFIRSIKIGDEDIVLKLEDGREEIFIQVSEGVYSDGTNGTDFIEHLSDDEEEYYYHESMDKTKYIYDLSGRLKYKTDDAGKRTTYSYDEADRVIAVSALEGKLTLNYSEDNHIETITDNVGNTVTYTLDGENLTCVKWPGGETYLYEYSDKGEIVGVINPRGIKTVENVYTDDGRISLQIFPDGGSMGYEYNDNEHMVTLTEQNGNKKMYSYDERLRTTREIDLDGETSYTYNDMNKRTSVTDKGGNTTKYSYDGEGNLIDVTNPLNQTVSLKYNEDSRLEEVYVNEELKLHQTYNENGRLVKSTDAIGRETTFTYNERNLTDSVIQPDDSPVKFEYDDRGNLTKVINPDGSENSYLYDSGNHVVESVNGEGQIYKYTYDKNHKITSVTNPLGDTRTYTYDGCGKVTKLTEYDGTTKSIEYGPLNKPEKLTDANGNETLYKYDLMWNVSEVVNPLGGNVKYSYNITNQLTHVSGEGIGEIFYEYDKVGNRTKEIGSNGEIITHTYDALSNVTSTTDANGNKISYSYDMEGRIQEEVNPKDGKTTYEYDKAGQLICVTNPVGGKTKYTYTKLGKVSTVIDPANRETLYTYNKGGTLSKVTFSDGTYESYAYDKNGNVISKETQDIVNQYEYDKLNRIIKIIDNAKDPRVITYTYNAADKVTSMTDANGNTTKYSYDNVGNLISVTDALGGKAKYTYDALNQLIKVEQSGDIQDKTTQSIESPLTQGINGKATKGAMNEIRSTTYKRNNIGQVTSIINAVGDEETYIYDLSGRVSEKIDRDGYKTGYSYTKTGQPEVISYGDEKEVRFSYDALGKLKEIEDWLGITRIETDVIGRVEKVTNPDGKEVSYEWGAANERKQITYPQGSKVEYLYDKHLRLDRVIGEDVEVEYSYNDKGRLEAKSDNKGRSSIYAYTPLGHLDKLTHKSGDNILESYGYNYDLNGNKVEVVRERFSLPTQNEISIQGKTQSIQGKAQGILEETGGTYGYQYDELNRLIGVTKDDEVLRSYGYDAFGNRVSKTEGDNHTAYTYNSLNQLMSIKDSNEEIYNYDKRGNLNQVYKNGNITKAYSFGAMNRLDKAFNYESNKGASYIYNGLGHRTGVVEGTIEPQLEPQLEPHLQISNLPQISITPTKRIDDVLDLTKQYHNLLTRSDADNTTTYMWDRNVISASNGDNVIRYLQDDLGSPSRVLDETHGIDDVYAFDEFGIDLSQGEEHIQPFTYTGYREDRVAGTYYAQAREYVPGVGRFTGEDIIKGSIITPFTMNHYTYCWNRPMDLVDLDGMAPEMNYQDIQNMQVATEEIKQFMATEVFGTSITHYSNETDAVKVSITSEMGGDILVKHMDIKDEVEGYSVNVITPKILNTNVEINLSMVGSIDKWSVNTYSRTSSNSNNNITSKAGDYKSWNNSYIYYGFSAEVGTNEIKLDGQDMSEYPADAIIDIDTKVFNYTGPNKRYVMAKVGTVVLIGGVLLLGKAFAVGAGAFVPAIIELIQQLKPALKLGAVDNNTMKC
ncbi:MAG: DUF6531 domain-containing protein [Suipraeoptans sp.]